MDVPPPASRHHEAMRALFAAFGHHGKPLRGLMSTPKAPNLDGRFGRMFHMPAATYGTTDIESRSALIVLGMAMTAEFDLPKDGPDDEESGIPALYTYFGQFIDHDITFDPVTILRGHYDPDALTDFRTPALDLDNMYGRGPSDQPYMYDGPTNKFLLGEKLDSGAHDLLRNNAVPARAIIGDPRNDENSIVSQLQGLMLRFHNRVVDDYPKLDFLSHQRIVRWHYQWVVVHDFLERIVSDKVLNALKTNGRYDQDKLRYFQWKDKTHMPVEFSAAAYRLGHSMIRPGYRLNDNDEALLPIFPVLKQGSDIGLTGFQAMAKNRGIDWGRFIDVGEPRAYGKEPGDTEPADDDTKKRLQFAYRLDPSLVNPLGELPKEVVQDEPISLAQRNLLRGYELGLPTGQDVARYMGVTPLTDEQIMIGKAVDAGKDGAGAPLSEHTELAAFWGRCPLWTYILAEAAHNRIKVKIPVIPPRDVTTPQLGEVGGRIVAEVLLGLLFRDKDSFLSCDPCWEPTIGNVKNHFRLRDLVAYAQHEPKAGIPIVSKTYDVGPTNVEQIAITIAAK